MYKQLNAKLLVMPDWLFKALEAYGKRPTDILTDEGLGSILSEPDVEFYKKQVMAFNQACYPTRGNGLSALGATIESLTLLHSNLNGLVGGGGASLAADYVKINTLYGKKLTGYDFFDGKDMLDYLPREIAAAMEPTIKVDPIIERCDNDLFLVRFSLGLYDKNPEEIFIRNTVELLLNEYGFDAVALTKLFDYYTLMPLQGN